MNETQLIGIHRIDDEVSIAGELSPEQLQQASQQGFKSVVNLRMPKEKGFLPDESQIVESLGMQYAHIPVNPSALSGALVAQISEQIDQLPKPVLMHCSLGLRSAGIALLRAGVNQGITVEEFLQRTAAMGLNFDDRPSLKRFFLDYITQSVEQLGGVNDQQQ
ncbi:MAG: sulfur transferase domain-containing protein [Cyanobacteria bacterium]|nr:sulfur transferase domain-containing protein [Cyanobacteriota bacterium]MDW8200660.1 sulfur transferase domain-containing protein [Cyanobacteriota bacterium SKYGB_h_bin112]